jgi:hypothetical protein
MDGSALRPGAAVEAAVCVAERLNDLASEPELTGAGLVSSRTRQGVAEWYLIDVAMLRSIGGDANVREGFSVPATD